MRKLLRVISSYPNYFITNNGRVWSNYSQKWIKPTCEKTGHFRVWLYNKGRRKSEFVHNLVLETYQSKCPDGYECRHLDGNPKNNKLSNLKWGTKSENQIDSVRHHTAANLKLYPYDVRIIIYMLKTKEFLQKEIANLYKITQSSINDIKYKRTWRHLWTQ